VPSPLWRGSTSKRALFFDLPLLRQEDALRLEGVDVEIVAVQMAVSSTRRSPAVKMRPLSSRLAAAPASRIDAEGERVNLAELQGWSRS
jgi:hypothetical protein